MKKSQPSPAFDISSLPSAKAWTEDPFTLGKIPPKDYKAMLVFVGSKGTLKDVLAQNKGKISSWQLPKSTKLKDDVIALAGAVGPMVIVNLAARPARSKALKDENASPYSSARDIAGKAMSRLEEFGATDKIQLDFLGETEEQKLGFMVGLSLAAFQFTMAKPRKKRKMAKIHLAAAHRSTLAEARRVAGAINLARFLVSLPANHLSPTSYAAFVKKIMPHKRGVTTTILDKSALKREKMGLFLSIAEGSRHAPALVHIRYRPSGSQKPCAFVGKGITFDTGGLDIKSSSTMRSMKKDMAGSAVLVALAHYWTEANLQKPFDIYLPIAENRIDGHSLCPGDVISSRKGLSVEISNTDAEGRLLLADACHYAATRKGKDRPRLLIDVATLTGAAKVALGPDLMALFCNDNKLAETIEKASLAWGDPLWRLPLYAPYLKALKSPCADLQNCSSSAYAGAITAALFVQKFTEGLPWAHLDIMAWAENFSAGGAIASGANGQAVQCLIGLAQLLE